MPELPEVETTVRGVRPHLAGRRIVDLEVRQRQLRWPVPTVLDQLPGSIIQGVRRRAKYVIIDVVRGLPPEHAGVVPALPSCHILIHLGMSGSLRVIDPDAPVRKHDHVVLTLDSSLQLRFHDPRRFGCWLWTEEPAEAHPLLHQLGPEPLSAAFNGPKLAGAARAGRRTIKELLLDGRIVAGVGNIYACEALHLAGIHPRRAAGRISAARLNLLAESIREVLLRAVEQGGTTLRDFLREDGQPGYFKQKLLVYDREHQPCRGCTTPVRRIQIGQRSTFYCPRCQR